MTDIFCDLSKGNKLVGGDLLTLILMFRGIEDSDAPLRLQLVARQKKYLNSSCRKMS
jgi:hypothetical protein